jgi:hypothetical protein
LLFRNKDKILIHKNKRGVLNTMETRYKIIINDVSEEFITTLIEKGYIVERFDINEELVKASEVEKEIVETKIELPEYVVEIQSIIEQEILKANYESQLKVEKAEAKLRKVMSIFDEDEDKVEE